AHLHLPGRAARTARPHHLPHGVRLGRRARGLQRRARRPLHDAMRPPYIRPVATIGIAVVAAGCSGVQSALAPSGYHAGRVASLFWWMTGISIVIWALVIALAMYYVWTARGERNRRRDR